MAWFNRQKSGVEDGSEGEKKVRTEGLVAEMREVRPDHLEKALDESLQVCPKCEHHFRIDARQRLATLFDNGEFQEHDPYSVSTNPLNFIDSRTYDERLHTMQESTQLSDALISASGKLAGRQVNICAMELKFIGGSMGAVVGEKSRAPSSAR
jgi:acetyl-CoA carboxylase carboxyl transferase subunit beta